MTPGRKRGDQAVDNGPAHTQTPPPGTLSAYAYPSPVLGYVVVVETTDDKRRRRVFLSLHSASAAAERALTSGHNVRLLLCELRPVSDHDVRADGDEVEL